MENLCFPNGQERHSISNSDQLMVIKPPPPPREKPSIFDLPDELLLIVFELAVDWDSFPIADTYERGKPVRDYHGFSSLCLVCHRFRRLVTPLLYREIDISNSSHSFTAILSPRALRLLHRTLLDNPSACLHTRRVYFDIFSNDDDNLAVLPMLVDLATWLTNTRSLVLGFARRGAGGDDDLPVLLAAAFNMTKLEKLCVFAGNTDIATGLICGAVGPLQHLQEFTYYPGRYHPIQTTILQSSSSTKILHLHSFPGPGADLHILLAWPIALECFTHCDMFWQDDFPPISLSIVASSLAPHKNTLRKLDIGFLFVQGLRGFDLTEFEALEELNLSAWTTGSKLSNVEKLLAPRLRRLTWDFPVQGSSVARPLDGFKGPQEAWLRRLSQAAIQAESSLDLIYVNFYAVNNGRWADMLPEVYPWDYIDSVADEVKGAGIEVRYPKPILSRDDFYKWRNDPQSMEKTFGSPPVHG